MPVPITGINARAFVIPTDYPEADGMLEWDSTTLVLVQAEAGGEVGVGYTYASHSAATLINDLFPKILTRMDVIDIPICWKIMCRAVRNLGNSGQAACAVAAVDTALWDLKARILNVSLCDLMGVAKPSVPVYGSGGFTTYDDARITEQIDGWLEQGITMAKIKIGTHPEIDIDRVGTARRALGVNPELFVDANGAYTVKQALAFAHRFTDYKVTWFEEPVSSDNLTGLRQIRDAGPAGMDITAGEYGFTLFEHRQMLDAHAVDVLQIDVTRCQGYTGFMQAAALAQAANIPVSSHCAPALHLPVCLHVPHLRHMEYFHDHVRIEKMLFDGAPLIKEGYLVPDRAQPGHGLEFREKDAERFAV
ncbi:MAG TPA: enolase C-terminal domain-like protein [Patescibacteria group bacterium]|nr:enolase C-terminal domain-like protein [Patescibacteria group bacterium]